ncbi:MAG: hypothetical protein HW394_1353 [Acidobacteria bacterium]|nr:hypothetical protein [Acidobacteriota bacterium]
MRIYQHTGWRSGLLALALVCAPGGPAAAQWLSLPVPGIPRTADGKPNLNAPTPRTADGKPDHSGLWLRESPRANAHLAPDGTQPPMLPWAADLYKRRVATHGYDRPMTFCMPHGVPDAMTAPYPFKLIQTPVVTVHLYEEFTKYRQIHTDGRQLPVDPNPAWYGYSVGRWEGETLVVDTAGFKEGTWLDNDGHPHTDALRLTERFRRTNFGSMGVDVTIDDPKAYSRPWTSQTIRLVLQPDTELIEHLCENNRDLGPMKEFWDRQVPAAPGRP